MSMCVYRYRYMYVYVYVDVHVYVFVYVLCTMYYVQATFIYNMRHVGHTGMFLSLRDLS